MKYSLEFKWVRLNMKRGKGNASRHQWIENPLHQSPEMTLCSEVTSHWWPPNGVQGQDVGLVAGGFVMFWNGDMCGCHNHGTKDKCGSSSRRTGHKPLVIWETTLSILKVIPLSECLEQCPNLAGHANTKKLMEMARTHRLWYTCDCSSHEGWVHGLTLTSVDDHPMILTSTPSINQTHPLSLSFNPHSPRPGMRP